MESLWEKEALSAVGGTTGTLINLLVGFFVGMSSGAAVVVSQFYGAKEDQQVQKSVHTSFCLALAGGVALLVIGEIFTPAAIRAMGAPEEILGYSVTYLRIYFLGIIGNLVYNMGAAILRAVGDSEETALFPCGELPDQYCSGSPVCSLFSYGSCRGGACDDHVPALIGNAGYGNVDPDEGVLPV